MAAPVEVEEMESGEEEGVVVGQKPTVMVPRHIKKRALRNKALSVSFDEKGLRDYITGFHKRKKKRRKEAQRQLEEKERLKRIEARKKRKQEKELALYGRVLSSQNPVCLESDADDACNNHGEKEDEDEHGLAASISETKTYEDGSTRITVTTSEISREDDVLDPKHAAVPKANGTCEKNRSLAAKKRPLKRASKNKAHRRGKKSAFQKKGKSNRKGKKR